MTRNKLSNWVMVYQKGNLKSETLETLAIICIQHMMLQIQGDDVRGRRHRWLQTDPVNIFWRWDLETTRTTKTHSARPAECHSLLDPLAHSTPHKPPQFQLCCLRHDHNNKQENQAMEHTRTERQNHSHFKKKTKKKTCTHTHTQTAHTVAAVTLTMA